MRDEDSNGYSDRERSMSTVHTTEEEVEEELEEEDPEVDQSTEEGG